MSKKNIVLPGRVLSALLHVASVLMLALALSTTSKAYAQLKDNPNEYEEDYDFSWLDPDKKIYVIQNRKYSKERRIELMLSLGLSLKGPYSDGSTLMGRGAYYFNDQWGASVVGMAQSNSKSDTLRELQSVSTAFPGIRNVISFFGGSVIWVPSYGKMNLFNNILYIDWPIELGIASVSTETDLNTSVGRPAKITNTTHTGLYLSTGLKFFVSRQFAVRLDALGLYYSAPEIFKGDISDETKVYDNYCLSLGLSMHL